MTCVSPSRHPGRLFLHAPNQGLTAAATTYFGKEGGTDGTSTRMLLDGVVTKDIGNLSAGVNVDYLKFGTPYWFGVAGMGRYTINDSFNVAARAEYIYDKSGGYFVSVPEDTVSLYEFTGQGSWTVGKHYELRLEIRADMSNKDEFVKGTTARKNQVTGLLGALAYF